MVDTLRADALSPYGNVIIETPAMSTLADDGVLYERRVVSATVVDKVFYDPPQKRAYFGKRKRADKSSNNGAEAA